MCAFSLLLNAQRQGDWVGHGFGGHPGPRGRGGLGFMFVLRPALRRQWDAPAEYPGAAEAGTVRGISRAVGLGESLHEGAGRGP